MDVEQQVERLERANRWLWRAGLAMLALVLGVLGFSDLTSRGIAQAAEISVVQEAPLGRIDLENVNFEWCETAQLADPEYEPPFMVSYLWSARVTNDTTSMLDIIVIFALHDAGGEVVKETRASAVRLMPAEERLVFGCGAMEWDEANRVHSTAATYTYEMPTA